MQTEPERTRDAGVLTVVPIEIDQRRPVVLSDRVGLDEREVPRLLRVAGDPERQLPAVVRHGDRVGQPLVRQVGDLSDGEVVTRARHRGNEQVGVERVPELDAVLTVGVNVELADRHRGEVRRHRFTGVPCPRRRSVPSSLPHQHAVGDRLQPGRHGDLERVRRLVGRVVVDREPRRCHVRLAGHDRAVVGVEEAGDAEHVFDQLRDSVVAHHGRELAVLAQPSLRNDRQLTAVPAPLAGRPSTLIDRR